MKGRWRLLALAGAAALLVGGVVAWAAEVLIVVEKEAAIRKERRTYSPRLAKVPEGAAVTVLAREKPWIRVSYEGVEGWMNESAVTADRNVVLSTSATARGVRATEQDAASRGFSPEVEREYRKTRPELNTFYELLDAIASWSFPEEKIVRFIEEGRLAGGGGGS